MPSGELHAGRDRGGNGQGDGLQGHAVGEALPARIADGAEGEPGTSRDRLLLATTRCRCSRAS